MGTDTVREARGQQGTAHCGREGQRASGHSKEGRGQQARPLVPGRKGGREESRDAFEGREQCS